LAGRQTQLRAWRAFMSVQMRMNYEMNRQLQNDTDLPLADYHILNALTDAPDGRLQVSALAAIIGWELSRASHANAASQSVFPRRRTAGQPDAILTRAGREAIEAAAWRWPVTRRGDHSLNPNPQQMTSPTNRGRGTIYRRPWSAPRATRTVR
jgi:hypothetical protein